MQYDDGNTVFFCSESKGRVESIYMEKAFTCALFWLLETSQLPRYSQGHGNGRCPWDVFMDTLMLAHSHVLTLYINVCMGNTAGMGYCINSSAWVLRCSFYYTGQCEGLKKRSG